jgi:hypothetical protein
MAIPYNSDGNSPQNLNLNDFRSKLNSYGQVAKGCRYAVTITPDNASQGSPLGQYINQFREMIYVCDAFEFPGRGFNVNEVRYYGPSQKLPNNVQYSDTNASFICRNDSIERKLFDDWMDVINPTDSYNFNYASDYYATIKVYQFHEIGQILENTGTPSGPGERNYRQYTYPDVKLGQLPVYGWTLYKAWPTLVAPQQVTWADQDILRLQVSFTYRYWDRPNVK